MDLNIKNFYKYSPEIQPGAPWLHSRTLPGFLYIDIYGYNCRVLELNQGARKEIRQ